jgi:hypothetical protein
MAPIRRVRCTKYQWTTDRFWGASIILPHEVELRCCGTLRTFVRSPSLFINQVRQPY